MLRRRILLQSAHGVAEYVDLGLPSGLLWATGNIVKDAQGNYSMGLKSDYGCYFSWGNIDGHNESESYNFSSSNYKRSPGESLTADISSSDVLHDAALARLGAPWHLPSSNDFQELIDYTDNEFVNDFNNTGVAGMKFMKKTDHSVYLFLPASGYISLITCMNFNSYLVYWTSSYVSSSNSYSLFYNGSILKGNSSNARRYGMSIHPVTRPYCNIVIIFNETDSSDVSGKTVTVTDAEGIVHTSTIGSNKKATIDNVSYGICTVSINSYLLNPSTITVNISSKTFTLNCRYVPLGVWAYYSDGSLKSEAEADSNAIGVAVITNNCSFVIDKVATNGNNDIEFGGYHKDLSNIGVVCTSTQADALLDYDGESNTTKIINALSGYTDSESTVGAPAAEACRAAFSGQGYLPSLGELKTAYDNKSSVDSMMTKIGGTAFSTNFYWASTLYDSSYVLWILRWYNGAVNYGSRDRGFCVRAFRAL